LCIFCCFFCCWVLVLLHYGQTVCRGLFQFSYICWALLCALRYGLFWRQFHGLPRECILCYCWMEYSVDIRSIRSMVSFSSRISFLSFLVWMIYWCSKSIKFPTTTMLGSICVFKSSNICLMKLGAPTLSTYKLTIFISSRYISPFYEVTFFSSD
jgi:hypothetical protein